jgi:hypothetical protein
MLRIEARNNCAGEGQQQFNRTTGKVQTYPEGKDWSYARLSFTVLMNCGN